METDIRNPLFVSHAARVSPLPRAPGPILYSAPQPLNCCRRQVKQISLHSPCTFCIYSLEGALQISYITLIKDYVL